MIQEYHFDGGPISGHVLLCQFPESNPGALTVASAVANNLNRHFYAIKELRKAEYRVIDLRPHIYVQDTSTLPPESVPHYELLARTFIWTINDPE